MARLALIRYSHHGRNEVLIQNCPGLESVDAITTTLVDVYTLGSFLSCLYVSCCHKRKLP